MPITSKDIAKRAGVSRGTVDRVLNNRPGVKSETRMRIEAIIAELGYVPSRAGKALSTAKRPVSIGIILNRGENKFFDQVIAGMESCKEDYADFTLEYHYTLLADYTVQEQIQAIQTYEAEQISFLIISPIDNPAVAQAMNHCSQQGIPIITVNSDIHNTKRMLHVGCDYFASGQTAAGLIQLMTQQVPSVVVVTGSRQVLGHNQRVEGFHSLLSTTAVVESHDKDNRAYDELKCVLQQHPTTNVVYFAASGVEGGIRAIKEVITTPIIVVTCDDMPFIQANIRNGTIQATVCQEPFRQGYEAINQGLQYLITGQTPEVDTLFMKNEIKIAQNIDK